MTFLGEFYASFLYWEHVHLGREHVQPFSHSAVQQWTVVIWEAFNRHLCWLDRFSVKKCDLNWNFCVFLSQLTIFSDKNNIELQKGILNVLEIHDQCGFIERIFIWILYALYKQILWNFYENFENKRFIRYGSISIQTKLRSILCAVLTLLCEFRT